LIIDFFIYDDDSNVVNSNDDIDGGGDDMTKFLRQVTWQYDTFLVPGMLQRVGSAVN